MLGMTRKADLLVENRSPLEDTHRGCESESESESNAFSASPELLVRNGLQPRNTILSRQGDLVPGTYFSHDHFQ